MRITICLYLICVSCGSAMAQDSLPPVHRSWMLNLYPGALLWGDLSAGIEYRSKRTSHELSANIKVIQPHFYLYDQGHRFDYVARYVLYEKKRWTFSPFLCLTYLNIWYKDKSINYYDGDVPAWSTKIYRTVESHQLRAAGPGTGMAIHCSISKRILAGLECGILSLTQKVTRDISEIYFTESAYSTLVNLQVPSHSVSIHHFVSYPFGRISFSRKF